ncbi:hypothetical protein PGB90_000612 [Kerria lacca]
MTSPAGITDINTVFNTILFNEEFIIEEAFADGIKKGIEEGKEEGYHLGFHKGIEVGVEVGYYKGIVKTLSKLYEKNEISLNDKILNTLKKLNHLLQIYPQFNCPNTDIIQLLLQIKSYFRQLCSLLKFDGSFIKNELNF